MPYRPGVDNSAVLRLLQRELERLRLEYVANGHGDVFDRHIAQLKAEGLYPFED